MSGGDVLTSFAKFLETAFEAAAVLTAGAAVVGVGEAALNVGKRAGVPLPPAQAYLRGDG